MREGKREAVNQINGRAGGRAQIEGQIARPGQEEAAAGGRGEEMQTDRQTDRERQREKR